MTNYIKYTLSRYDSFTMDNFGNNDCFSCDFVNNNTCNGVCRNTCVKLGLNHSTYDSSVVFNAGDSFYCKSKLNGSETSGISSYAVKDGEYNVGSLANVCGLVSQSDRWADFYECKDPSSVNIEKVYVTSEQTADMGTALVQGGAGLLHIGIQLLPYLIAFTIIMLIFGLIKNWSKLKNKGLGDSNYAGTSLKKDAHGLETAMSYGQDVILTPDYIDALNFYEKEEGNFDGTGKYYRSKNGKVAYRYKYDGKWYTDYSSDEAIIDDILPDKEHHYKKRHNLYND